MIIRDHCLPGSHRNREGWLPTCEWPEDCVVQWGKRGVVFAAGGDYATAFFEAFPTNPATFIRGEGSDVSTAEQAAFVQFQRQASCPNHQLQRKGYRNGAAVCVNCGLFVARAFDPLPDAEQVGIFNQLLAGKAGVGKRVAKGLSLLEDADDA